MSEYKKYSITLTGAVGLGTGVMISAGIFALLGQVAELAGKWFPFIFIAGGVVTAFSAYSYIKMSNQFPSAGGIGMYLVKSYGKGTLTASAALMMAFSMVINQSLVARTFGTYTLQLFDAKDVSFLIPALGVGLLLLSFLVNISGNKFIQSFTSIMSLFKIIGLTLLALAGLWAVGLSFTPAANAGDTSAAGISEIVASIALTILAFKGFTTITNSGSEIIRPNKNVGRAIMISIVISLLVYLLLAWSVSSSLSLDKIIEAKNYALAEAAKPSLGQWGLWSTVIIAIIATITGIIASVFAVSRMLAMLTNMKLIPHKHFGMPGRLQKHTLVYTIVLAMALTVLFDLSRIASMGAILYIVMDIIIHWGVLTKLRAKVDANPYIVIGAIVLDTIVLAAFVWVKLNSDLLIVAISALFIVIIFAAEKWFLAKQPEFLTEDDIGEESHHHS